MLVFRKILRTYYDPSSLSSVNINSFYRLLVITLKMFSLNNHFLKKAYIESKKVSVKTFLLFSSRDFSSHQFLVLFFIFIIFFKVFSATTKW